jgi:pilus assembly protein Flp/PilA
MRHLTKRLLNDESGQDLIEYALVIAVIAFGCVAAIGGIANPVVNAYYTVTNNFNNDV